MVEEMDIILRDVTFTISVRRMADGINKHESKSFSVSTSLDIDAMKKLLQKECEPLEIGLNRVFITIQSRKTGQKNVTKSFMNFLKSDNTEEIFKHIKKIVKNYPQEIKEVPKTTHVLVVKNILSREQPDIKCYNVTLEKDVDTAVEQIKEYVTKELCNVLENDIIFTGISRNTSSHRIMLWCKKGKANSKCFTIMFPNYSSEEIMDELKKGFKK